MEFEYKSFSDLSPDELYDILKLRTEVFVVEQNCVYNDLDDFDKEATHMFARKDDELVAYSRLLKPGTRFPDFSIGRVVVRQKYRKTGLGIIMMQEAKQFIVNNWHANQIKISAQKYLQQFYESLGFKAVTEEYLEDGIPHIGMIYKK